MQARAREEQRATSSHHQNLRVQKLDRPKQRDEKTCDRMSKSLSANPTILPRAWGEREPEVDADVGNKVR